MGVKVEYNNHYSDSFINRIFSGKYENCLPYIYDNSCSSL